VLNGHCNSPIAGYSSIVGAQMSLPASVLDEAGLMFIEASRSGPADRPRELGRAVGLELLDRSTIDRCTILMDCTEDGENLASHWLT
jgi:hydroxymethylbilane synthase